MSHRKRTPVEFPKMKVRGWRNRALVAKRSRYVSIYPHVAYKAGAPEEGVLNMEVLAEPNERSFSLSITWIRDGFGRHVSGPVIEMKKNERVESAFWIRQDFDVEAVQ